MAVLSLWRVFVDCEASGLGPASYPIEAGWAFVGAAGEIVKEAHLIAPTAEWLGSAGWNPDAEKIHGISREQLAAEGAHPLDVARAMNAALDGRTVHSDAPELDWFWL